MYPGRRSQPWLRPIFPEADVPVVQLSINREQLPEFHYELGQRLRPLRDEGVLLLGSGNVVHNLRAYRWKEASAAPFDWAGRFENTVCDFIQRGEHARLVDYAALGSDACLAIPTPDHYLPLLYVLGASEAGDAVRFHGRSAFDGPGVRLPVERVKGIDPIIQPID